MSLDEIALKASGRLQKLRGFPFDDRVKVHARKIMNEYALELELAYSIKVKPKMVFNAATGVMIMDVEPVTPRDAMMLELLVG